jgi:molybdenum cofactor biosynthesis protein B
VSHEAHRAASPSSVRCAVLTISDTRTLETDTGGAAIIALLEEKGHQVVMRGLVRDEESAVLGWVQRQRSRDDVDAILTTGGTGVAQRDNTHEAIMKLLDKPIPGFGELFRMLSYPKIGTSCLQSRADAGVARGTYIFCLPGSPGACRDGWDDILQHQLDIRHRPCNFAELLPRLREHERQG